jgi:uncharacterized protein YqjF (DUF2071 family)
MDLQAHLLLRDLLFINYAVDPDRLRPFVPAELQLDTVIDSRGRPRAFLSVVPFHVADVRSGVLPLPLLSFDQINYRAYVNTGEAPGVYFFDMRVNSRLVSATTSFLRMPVEHQDITIETEPVSANVGTSDVEIGQENPAPHTLRYSVASPGPHGLEAEVTIGDRHSSVGPEEEAVPPAFITDRPDGYTTAAGSLYRISVEHPPLDSLTAHVERVQAPALVSLGILNLDETARPHSVLYVREALFGTKIPRPVAEG